MIVSSSRRSRCFRSRIRCNESHTLNVRIGSYSLTPKHCEPALNSAPQHFVSILSAKTGGQSGFVKVLIVLIERIRGSSLTRHASVQCRRVSTVFLTVRASNDDRVGTCRQARNSAKRVILGTFPIYSSVFGTSPSPMIDRLNTLELFFSILLQSVPHLFGDVQHKRMGYGYTVLNLNAGKLGFQRGSRHARTDLFATQ